jgi:membrane-bound lytic murein transglycosylase D
VTPPGVSFDLHLPAGTATLFTQRIAAIPEIRRYASRYHRVAAGETLATVAHEYHVTEAALAAANQRHEGDSVEGVEALVVPAAQAAQTAASAPPARTLLYKTRRGDTLVTIADRYGVSLAQLRRWNNISGSRVEPGRRLHLAEPATPEREVSSHRRGARHAEAEEKETAPAKGAVSRSEARAESKSRGKSKGKPEARSATRSEARKAHKDEAAPAVKGSRKKPAQSSKSAAAEKKSEAASEKKSRVQKPAEQPKKHNRKQK